MYGFLTLVARHVLGTDTHTHISSKCLQRKYNGQDHGEVPMAQAGGLRFWLGHGV